AMVAAAQWLGLLHEALAIGGFTAEQLAVAVDGLPAPLASCEASVRAAWESLPRSARQAWLERAVDPARASAPPSPHAHTPFGGAFLLLDDLAAIPWADATRGWPDACGTRAEVALPFLVLATCFGADRAPLLFADGSWRALFGVDPTLDLPAAREWLDTLGGERRRGLERMFAGDPAGRRADAWHRVELAGSAWRVRIDEGGTWRACTRACGATASAECDDTQAQAVADDLDYLLGAATGRSAWPRTIAVAAQRVVHAFLQRIPGFARTHLRHARRNFLEAAATVEPEDARIVVRLARPPLALMLNLAGLNRGQRRWPALDTRPFAIFTES
ncbi:MAG TPA: hypothetical protein VFP44_14995, partial [Usitatibacter sp.]|nr:hypothetical protein [Usitatibacter sp.]